MGPLPALPYPGWSEDKVIVPANYFEEGRLPGICVVTGAPATSNLRRRFSTTPGWVGCLLFVSWFALLIAVVATRRRASGSLPVCNTVALRVRRRHAIAVRLFILAVVVWLATFPVAAVPVFGPAASPLVLGLAAAGLAALCGSAFASTLEGAVLGSQGRVFVDGFGARWVELRGVHPAFARAVAARLGL
jgi:hypothetical protein